MWVYETFTVAILAQGTSWAVADTQAFLEWRFDAFQGQCHDAAQITPKSQSVCSGIVATSPKKHWGRTPRKN